MNANVMGMLQTSARAYQAGDHAQALQLSEEALQIAPDHPEALHMKALALGKLGRIDEAIPNFDAAARAHPQRHAILTNKGNALSSAERWDDAEKAYKAALAANPQFLQAKRGLSAVYREREELAKALEVLTEISSMAPDEPVIQNDIGNIYVLMERYEEALSAFNKAIALQPNFALALVNRGAAFRRLGRVQEAIVDHEKAITLIPNHAEALYQLAATYQKSGQLADAGKRFRDALQLEPLRADIHRELARMLWESGRQNDFLALLDQSITETQDDSLMALKAELAFRAGQMDVAEISASEAIQRNSQNVAAHRALGRVQHYRNEPAAIDSLRSALAIAPGDFDTRHALAEALLGGRCISEALEVLSPDAPPSHLQAQIALKTTAMRLAGDAAYEKFYDYDRFTRKIRIETPEGYASLDDFNKALLEAIEPLHHYSVQPIDQTLYGGTQSTGRLWDEPNEVIQALRQQLLATASHYIDALPEDETHPFLSRKTQNIQCAGAWSVILKDGGGHVDHFHPEGWISAVYYVNVPPEVSGGDEAGFLRLGKPGVSRVSLEAERFIKPEEGAVVFFPSYMWHGVEPFSSHTPRVTAPFDLAPISG